MSSNQTWADRRALFQKGKELHEPVSPTGRKFSDTPAVSAEARRLSNSGETKPDVAAAAATSTAGRRRSSASSGGMFNNLTNMKRGSQDYGDRRTSQQEMMGSSGGIVSGWFNQTFKGYQKPADGSQK
ncbi:hypothetical protein BDY17DRAFT_327005 [Neohortaea acidophila]|uniref:Uncharacterized protein n=1 Tax=Neohortaea acidophila TaxID=245834 RepID=A0A6A6PJ22_9PEZI|nr:uncharacterized protein BDY17DRAFT_327005 [Neohortaea acidophila]KAF2480019.1 hypothetical protein BDY17DRAFT_327005 [Neohortaea acidophila]